MEIKTGNCESLENEENQKYIKEASNKQNLMSYKQGKSNAHEQKYLRNTLRNNATAAECILWIRISGRKAEGLKFRRQHGIGPYVMDFYCPEILLCIEIDGEVHKNRDTEIHDAIRTKYLNSNGITVLRFDNDIVYQNIEYIIDCIRQFKESHYGSKNIKAKET